MRSNNFVALSADDSANANGIQIDADQLFSASFHFVFGDNTATGTVKVQASNDIFSGLYAPGNFVVTNWIDVASASAAVTAGAAQMISLPNLNYRWLRVVWTRSAGGSTTVICNANIQSV